MYVAHTVHTYKGGEEEGLERQGLGWVSPMGHGSPQRRGGLLVGQFWYCFQMFALLSREHTRLGWVSSWPASSWGPLVDPTLEPNGAIARPPRQDGKVTVGLALAKRPDAWLVMALKSKFGGALREGRGAIPYTVP